MSDLSPMGSEAGGCLSQLPVAISESPLGEGERPLPELREYVGKVAGRSVSCATAKSPSSHFPLGRRYFRRDPLPGSHLPSSPQVPLK